ncbi:MAG: TrmH family RNA methyltransferase [Candidatus Pacebacteria bacterium]|nr:TrmH family RNA methyltransferase [Candidatus Paceibacterota bacterium]
MVFLILHNIRSTHNVGSIFRTADAAGVSKIFLTGYTPTPVDKFGRERKDIAKTALGAEKNIPWVYAKTPTSLIKNLKKERVKLIAIEQHVRAVDYKKVKLTENKKGERRGTAFLVGNEVKGMSKQLLAQCDVVAEIPMKGKKESLNVSVSFGIALFRILNI